MRRRRRRMERIPVRGDAFEYVRSTETLREGG
jgi:hypothetical protein